MDILNTVKSALGGGEGDKQNDLMSTVMNLVGGQSGGLNGLISQFTSKGLGDVVGSWVGTGKNLPVSSDQIQSVLGSDQIKNLASKLGIDANAITSQLSNLLPQVVDRLTPEGKVPEGDIMSKEMDLLGGLFGNK
ncbi:MAG: YidB family protein [Ignavibacteria bacterium]|nr:YidB family protein [Ignavibacteria bacterium]